MIIWDEYKYGKKIYESCEIKTKKWQTNELRALVKYLIIENPNIKPIEIRKTMEKCCSDDIKYLENKQKTNLFNKIILQCKDSDNMVKVIMNKNIIIYESEINKIKEVKNKEKEKILFVLLVYSKWLNLEWFSISKSDIINESDNKKINSKSFQNLLYELIQDGYLRSEVIKLDRTQRRIEKTTKKQMWKIEFLDNSGDIAFEFNNYINFVNRYLNYVYNGYYQCGICGGMFLQNDKNNRINCIDCSKYHPIETKIIQCVDCGKDVVVNARNMTKIRCDKCQDLRNKELKKERNIKYYNKKKPN